MWRTSDLLGTPKLLLGWQLVYCFLLVELGLQFSSNHEKMEQYKYAYISLHFFLPPSFS